MQWLRAKARKDRWAEEHLLVRHEMDWTVNFFNGHMEQWLQLSEDSGAAALSGHQSYAARQAEMYRRFALEAAEAFRPLFIQE